jgi:hypothetical protein
MGNAALQRCRENYMKPTNTNCVRKTWSELLKRNEELRNWVSKQTRIMNAKVRERERERERGRKQNKKKQRIRCCFTICLLSSIWQKAFILKTLILILI